MSEIAIRFFQKSAFLAECRGNSEFLNPWKPYETPTDCRFPEKGPRETFKTPVTLNIFMCLRACFSMNLQICVFCGRIARATGRLSGT